MPLESAAASKPLLAFFVALGAAINVAIGKEATVRSQLVTVLSAIGWGYTLAPLATQFVSNYIHVELSLSLTQESTDSLRYAVSLSLGLVGGIISAAIVGAAKILAGSLESKVK